MTSIRSQIANHVVLGAFAAFTLLPLVAVLLVAVRPDGDLSTRLELPDSIDIGNFADAWQQAEFSTFIRNSVVVSIAVMIGTTVLATLAGYAFGTMSFPGRNVLFYMFLIAIVLPYESVVVSWFYTFRELEQTDTWQSLILPQLAIFLGFGTFWMRAFFLGVPRDLISAASLDGANSWQILWRVLVPIGKPAISTLMVLTFMWSWNAFLLPLVMITSQDGLTAPLGLTFFSGDRTTDVSGLAAASIIVATPVVLLYVALQRTFIRGLLSGGVKG